MDRWTAKARRLTLGVSICTAWQNKISRGELRGQGSSVRSPALIWSWPPLSLTACLCWYCSNQSLGGERENTMENRALCMFSLRNKNDKICLQHSQLTFATPDNGKEKATIFLSTYPDFLSSPHSNLGVTVLNSILYTHKSLQIFYWSEHGFKPDLPMMKFLCRSLSSWLCSKPFQVSYRLWKGYWNNLRGTGSSERKGCNVLLLGTHWLFLWTKSL